MRNERVMLSLASVLLLGYVRNALPLGAARSAGSSGWGLRSWLARWGIPKVYERDGAGKCERDVAVSLQLRCVLEASESSCCRRVVCCLARVPRRQVCVGWAMCAAGWRGAVCLKVKG